MKKTLIGVAMLLSSINTMGQIIYTGTVYSNGVGVPNLLVTMKSADKTLGVLTDADGSFMFRLAPGDTATTMRFMIDVPQYVPLDTICSLGSAIELKVLPRVKELSEATVAANRVVEQRKGDVRIYKVNMEGLTKHADARQAMRQVPGLIHKDGTFQIVGKDGVVTYYIDGVQATDLQVKALEARDIERIEVQDYNYKEDLPNGSINIVLKKKPHKMLYAKATTSANLLFPQIYMGPEFSYYGNNIVLSYSGSYHYNEQEHRSETTRRYSDGTTEFYNVYSDRNVWQHGSDFNLRWFIGRRSDLAMGYTIFGLVSNGDQVVNQTLRSYTSPSTEDMLNQNAYLVFHHDIDNRSRFFVKVWGNRYNYGTSEAFSNNNTYSRTESLAFQVSIENDTMRIGRTLHSLAYGYKGLLRQNVIHGTLDKPSTTSHQLFFVDNFSLTRRLTGVLSLRGDLACISTNGYSKDYFDLLPQIELNYGAGKWGHWSLGYGIAVYRPAADYLNPALVRYNDYDQQKGNPDLHPERVHKLEIGASKQFGKLFTRMSASHSFGTEQISNIYETIGSYNLRTYANIGTVNATRFMLTLMRSFAKNRLNAQVSFLVLHDEFKFPENATILSVGNKGWSTMSYLSLSYLTTKNWSYDFSLNYTDRKFSENSIEKKFAPSVSFTIEKEVGEHWAFGLTFGDIGNWNSKSVTHYRLKDLAQRTDVWRDACYIQMEISFRFGKRFSTGDKSAKEGFSDLKSTQL